jgi:hypothetical protein
MTTLDPSTGLVVALAAVPMAEDVMSALQRYNDALAGMAHLSADLAALPTRMPTERWPRPGPPKPSEWVRRAASPKGLAPVDVRRHWKDSGRVWLSSGDGRTLRAAAIALQVQPYGGELASDAEFLTELLPRLRGRRLATAVASALFATWPPPQVALHALGAVRAAGTVPRWCTLLPDQPSRTDVIASALGGAVVGGELQKPGDLDVPEGAWEGEWGASIVRSTPARTYEAATRQLSFADAGQEPKGSLVTPAAAEALRSLVAVAERDAAARRDVAGTASRRVGSPFGAAAEARWKPVADLLPKVRAWLAGEVLEIVFEHLTPGERELARMTAPRKAFWKNYTGSVRRIWVAVSPSIEPQLRHPDVQRIRDVMGPDLQVRTLNGGPQQAIVWMHLEGGRGPITVIEGNANTSLRVRAGEFRPGAGRTVYYKEEVVDGALSAAEDAYVRPHSPGWESKAARKLWETFGIRWQA